jgi:hypothetical protein
MSPKNNHLSAKTNDICNRNANPKVRVNHCMQSKNGKGRYETITICCEDLSDLIDY